MEQGSAMPQSVGDKQMNNREENPYLVRQHTGWCGRFEADEWHCRCGRLAKLLPTRKGRNQGRSVYSCPIREPKKEDDLQPCQFFLWQDEQEEAKKWMELNPTTPRKQPPKARDIRTPKSPNNGSTKKMNEWLQSGKKRAIKDISDEDTPGEKEEDKESDEDFVVIENFEDGDIFNQNNIRKGSPSRKSAKVTRFATPGQSVNYTRADDRNALPTPATGGRESEQIDEACQFRARNTSPTPIRLQNAIDLDDSESELPPGKIKLLKSILGLVKTDYPDLKASTEAFIEHEIEEDNGKTQAEAKAYRRTIARLRIKVVDLEKKARDLEKTVSHLGGGSFADDTVVLSD